MRLSVYSDDPGYRAYRKMKRCGVKPVIRLDGQLIADCVTVDTKRGIVVVHARDEAGQLQLNADCETVKRKIMSGRVTLDFRRAPWQ